MPTVYPLLKTVSYFTSQTSTTSKCLFLAITILLLSPYPALAELPEAPVVLDTGSGGCVAKQEICGDGVDQDCNGSDLLCSGSDKDMDGFPAAQDCNDKNRFIYPGMQAQCLASCGTGIQKCNPDGSFSSCSCAPLCEATGNGKCYYISKLTGSDSNPGTFQKPFKTFLNIVSYYSLGDRPSGHKALGPGDVVYFMSGVYDENYSYNNQRRALFLRNIHGTSSNPVVFKAYPGAHPVLSSKEQEVAFRALQSSHLRIEGFEITKAYGAGIMMSEVGNVEIRNNWVHDVDGLDQANIAGIRFTTVRNGDLHHNIIHDNYDRNNADTGGEATLNSRNVVFFKGSNNRIHHNVIFQTPSTNARKTGGCFTYKHSADLAGYENQISGIDHNIFWNCRFQAIGSGSHRSRIHHNLIIDSAPIWIVDVGGITHHRDIIIEHNTIVNSSGVDYRPRDKYSPIGQFTFRKNIVIDNEASSPVSGIIDIDTYGTNSTYNKVVPTGLITFNQNCYFNTQESSPKFNLFGKNTPHSLGGVYSYSQWKGKGYDTNSVIANPRLDNEYKPTNSACTSMGHRAGW